LREAYTQTCPKWDNILTTTCMSMPFHDIMSSFINFRRVFDFLEFKTMYLNVSGRATVARCLTFILISCMGLKHATKDTDLVFQPIYMHWSMFS
jgi:hypothetical protein